MSEVTSRIDILSVPSKEELLAKLTDLQINKGLTELGHSCYGVVCDLLSLAEAPVGTCIVGSVDEAYDEISKRFGLLTANETEDDNGDFFVGYLTGGLEGGIHHMQLIETMPHILSLQFMVIGIEPDSYIRRVKGREPVISAAERATLWQHLAPPWSVVILLPERPEDVTPDIFYDELVLQLGLWKDEHVIFLGSSDDPTEVKEARRRRAADEGHLYEVSYGEPPMHVSEFLTDPDSYNELDPSIQITQTRSMVRASPVGMGIRAVQFT